MKFLLTTPPVVECPSLQLPSTRVPAEARSWMAEVDSSQVRVNTFRDKMFATDPESLRAPGRVYPYLDEAECIVRYIEERGYDATAEAFIDLAAGYGPITVGCPLQVRNAIRLGYDICSRAIQYAAFNAAGNESRAEFGLWDIRDGVAPSVPRLDVKNFLFSANMPFLSDPESLRLAADCRGMRSSSLTLATLTALKRFSGGLQDGQTGRAVVLAYALQNEEGCGLVQHAQAVFGADRVRWRVPEDARIYRVNGLKSCPNPMPLTKLPLKAECAYTVDDSQRDRLRLEYQNTVGELYAKGFTTLVMGLLDIQL
jgi:hypothetical protein